LFANRQELLRLLATTYATQNVTAVALTGLGGVGKTQLAVEFAHRYGRYFPGGVFWLNFADPRTIPTQIARCGQVEHMNLRPGFALLPLEQQVRLVQQTWQEPIPRLLIFDNCESETAFSEWQPSFGGCRILLTSQRSWWNPALGLTQINVDVLSRPDSIWLLQRFVPALTNEESAQIADTMADLPLALHLAGSYLARNGGAVSPQSYLAQMRVGQRLQHESLRAASYSPTAHTVNVWHTLMLNCQQLNAAVPTNQLAKWLLAGMAHLAPGAPVPLEILAALLPADTTLERLENARQRLLQLGLVMPTTTDSLRLHPLVAEYVREWTADLAIQTAVEEALITLTMQGNRERALEPAHHWRHHLVYVTAVALPRRDDRSARLCLAMGQHLFFSGDYFNGARYYLETAVSIQEEVAGPEHLDTAVCLEWLGRALISAQEFGRARTCLERALTIYQLHLAPDDIRLATIHNQVGIFLMTIAEFKPAQLHLEQAQQIYLHVLGDDQPDVAFNYHCLGLVLLWQGKYEQAEHSSATAVAILQQRFGLMHPDTARAANTLGLIHQRLGQLESARQLFEYAYTTRVHTLGESQSETLTSLNNLGGVYRELGNLSQAAKCAHEAAAKWEAAFGPESGYVALALNNLGQIYRDLGNFALSQAYLQQALSNRRQTYGEYHFYTADTLYNLGTLAQAQGDYASAQDYFTQSWQIRSQIYDADHPLLIQNQQAFQAIEQPPP
jgi:tetratricopeptide (TPR) repeat protein